MSDAKPYTIARLEREPLEAERERDEWKAKATEAAAQAERFRAVLVDAPSVLAPDPEWVPRVDAALSEPIAPWLAERDRAEKRELAMRVAEAVYRRELSEYLLRDQSLSDADRQHLAAIVDEALKGEHRG